MTDNFIPVFTNLLVDPYEFNPYEKKAAADEFEITGGEFENPDSGQLDYKEQPFKWGKVIAVGAKCEVVHKGDNVLFDIRGARPVFFESGYMVVAEQNLLLVDNNPNV